MASLVAFMALAAPTSEGKGRLDESINMITASTDEPPPSLWNKKEALQCDHIDQGASIGSLVCGNYETPEIALCLAGSARSFEEPLVHRTLKTNLIDAFGGDVTVFADIKLHDLRGDVQEGAGKLIEATEDGVRTALSHIGARPEHTTLDTAPYQGAHFPCGDPESDERWQGLRSSLAGQMAHKKQCYETITAAEKKRGKPFDYVMYTRPDLAWPIAIRPFCFWGGVTYFKWDWHIMGPRPAVDTWLGNAITSWDACDASWGTNNYPEKLATIRYLGAAGAQDGQDVIPAQITRSNDPVVPHNTCQRFTGIPGPDFKSISIEGEDAKEMCGEVTDFNVCANTRG